MSKARLVITAVRSQHRTVAEVAKTYDIDPSWVYKLLKRYDTDGEAAFTPRSRRPKTTPTATPAPVIAAILAQRDRLTNSGHDAGPETIRWHLQREDTLISRATIARVLTTAGQVTPAPKKKPKSAYIRFEAEQPNETWQSDFTHYPLTNTTTYPKGIEIITWLDDHSRYALHISAHTRITVTIVLDAFTQATGLHGLPASTLNDNGMVYTVRLSGTGRQGGRNAFEAHLATHTITQKNSRPNHPTTCGKVERFQQTMKNWLQHQPTQPATLAELQQLLDQFRDEYNNHRPHRSLHRTTPAAAYQDRPKATPTNPTPPPHTRVRHDKISHGKISLRHNSTMYHVHVGRAYEKLPVAILVNGLHITISDRQTGKILRQLTLDTTRKYQPQKRTKGKP